MENDATKPLETPAAEPVDEVKEEVQEQVVEPVAADEVAGGRAAFNCSVCGGDGLVLNAANVHERCTSCGGTGKVA